MKQINDNSKNFIKNLKLNEKKENITKNDEEMKSIKNKKKKYKSKSVKKLYPYKLNNNIINIKEENEISKIEKEIKDKEKKLKKLKIGDFEMMNNISKTNVNYRGDKTFIIFKSINDILYLIYSKKKEDKNNSIISYNLIDLKKVTEIKNAHIEEISNFRHYLDKYNKRDLILSISAKDNNLKVWEINNYQFLLNINNINRKGFLKSACFLNYKNQIFILTSNYSHSENSDPIKIYDLNGNKIKEINYRNNHTFFIDTYYDIDMDTNYIITGNFGYVKSYDYNNNKKYHKYRDNKQSDHYEHHSVIIYNNEDIIKMIETSENGEIRIWDFHSKELLNKIKVSDNNYDNLYGISLWNNDYIFIGCGNAIKLLDLNEEKVIGNLIGHNFNVITLKTIVHPKYGECLISQDLYDGNIKLWINKMFHIKYLIKELYEKLKID